MSFDTRERVMNREEEIEIMNHYGMEHPFLSTYGHYDNVPVEDPAYIIYECPYFPEVTRNEWQLISRGVISRIADNAGRSYIDNYVYNNCLLQSSYGYSWGGDTLTTGLEISAAYLCLKKAGYKKVLRQQPTTQEVTDWIREAIDMGYSYIRVSVIMPCEFFTDGGTTEEFEEMEKILTSSLDIVNRAKKIGEAYVRAQRL